MNLDKERLEILRALSHDRETLAVCDVLLRSTVRDEILKISQTEDRTKIFETLLEKYKEFDLAVIRAIFESANHFRKEMDIENVIQPFFRIIINELSNGETSGPRIEVLVHEIEKFSQSPQMSVQAVLNSLVVELLEDDKAAVRLVKSNRLSYSKQMEAAMVCVTRNLNDGYDAVISLAVQASWVKKEEKYHRLFIDLEPVLKKMGNRELVRLARLYDQGKLGTHGARLLAELGDTFANWFLASNLKPSSKWVKPLWQAITHVKNRSLRNSMAKKIIDDWVSDKDSKNILVGILNGKKARHPNFANEFDMGIRDKINLLAGPVLPPITINQVKTAASAADLREWNKFVRSVDTRVFDGRVLADSFSEVTDESRSRILKWINGINSGRLLREFFEHLLYPHVFKKISSEYQLKIVNSPKFNPNVLVKKIEYLLAADISFDKEVADKLDDTARDLREDF